MSPLKTSNGNSKLSKRIRIFSLPSGYACPGAHDCKSRVVEINGKAKIVDGKHVQFRCHEASVEVQRPNVRAARWHNFELLRNLKTKEEMASLLLPATEPNIPGIMRVHGAGDFFSQRYFDAWMLVARMTPKHHYYAYTKSIDCWHARLGDIPDNFVLTASLGGKYDHLITPCMRTARVVYSEETARDLGLQIDHDDSLAMYPGPNFALLLHGVQPKGSEASKAKQKLKVVSNWTGYSK